LSIIVLHPKCLIEFLYGIGPRMLALIGEFWLENIWAASG